jgi:hypothetical protein
VIRSLIATAAALALIFGVAFVLSGCGASWTPADAQGANNIVLTQNIALQLCAPDAGTCTASQVRALDQATLCIGASMLAHHGAPIPDDAGTGCTP